VATENAGVVNLAPSKIQSCYHLSGRMLPRARLWNSWLLIETGARHRETAVNIMMQIADSSAYCTIG